MKCMDEVPGDEVPGDEVQQLAARMKCQGIPESVRRPAEVAPFELLGSGQKWD